MASVVDGIEQGKWTHVARLADGDVVRKGVKRRHEALASLLLVPALIKKVIEWRGVRIGGGVGEYLDLGSQAMRLSIGRRIDEWVRAQIVCGAMVLIVGVRRSKRSWAGLAQIKCYIKQWRWRAPSNAPHLSEMAESAKPIYGRICALKLIPSKIKGTHFRTAPGDRD